MDSSGQLNHDDPQFVKVLETCLKMEIAAAKEKLNANSTGIRRMREILRAELDRRKQLKKRTAQMERILAILGETLTKLRNSISEMTDSLEVMRANADDSYKLMELRSREYRQIADQYRETWRVYYEAYEGFPLAKARNAARVQLQRLRIERMVVDYKRANAITVVRQRIDIDWMRTRCKIVEFAALMTHHRRSMEKLARLSFNIQQREVELRSMEIELEAQREREEDQRRLRKQRMLDTAPRKINIPYRQVYSQNRVHAFPQHHWSQERDDTVSVNTLALEELCINEGTVVLAEEREIRWKAVTPERAVLPEKATPETPAAGSSEDKAACEGKSEQPVVLEKTRDEVGWKRTRSLQETKGCSPIKTATSADQQPSPPPPPPPPPPASSSLPKIRRIETVHYNITPNPARSSARDSLTGCSLFSPTHYDWCDSNISSLDQDLMSKGPTSLYEGSLCNYKLSPGSNVSPVCVDENARMALPTQYTSRDDKRNQTDDRSTAFQFGNFAKNKTMDFTLF